jgi:hypothetical protein
VEKKPANLPIMYPSPMHVSVNEVIIAFLPGNSTIKMVCKLELTPALPTPSKNLH